MNKMLGFCLSVLVAALALALWQSRANYTALAQNAAVQSASIRKLTAEKAELQVRVDKTCPVVLSPPQNEIGEIFEPQNGEAKTKTDALKKRYEDMLVSYFLLRKCNANDVLDYHIIVSALSQEMASLQAPGRLQYDVLTSAQGSYKELYSGNQCDTETIEPLRDNYQKFIDNVAAQFLPNF